MNFTYTVWTYHNAVYFLKLQKKFVVMVAVVITCIITSVMIFLGYSVVDDVLLISVFMLNVLTFFLLSFQATFVGYELAMNFLNWAMPNL